METEARLKAMRLENAGLEQQLQEYKTAMASAIEYTGYVRSTASMYCQRYGWGWGLGSAGG
jgi:hypothetical protein